MTSHSREATSHSRRAGNFTRRAERDAQRAADAYRAAESQRSQAARLTARPDMWDYADPADAEANARAWVRIGDTFLRASAHDDRQAAFYRDLAARYRAMAARQADRLAV
jgi:hypothetical protein